MLLSGCGKSHIVVDFAEQPDPEPAASVPEAAPEPLTLQQWGIEVEALRLSAADRMLDFRYRVKDPQKAHELLKNDQKPWLVDKATGLKLLMPASTKIGPLRQATLKPQAGKVYFVMFTNPGGVVKRGGKVDIYIGDFVARDIIVQ
jgi:hypothetical protein